MAEINWAELHHDLLALIARRLNLIEDFLNFGNVCKSWHSAATKKIFNSDLLRVPWLMLSDDGGCSYREFFSLYNGMILKKRIPKASGKRCLEYLGWLITVGKDDCEGSLLHPFSGVQIELPHQNTTDDYLDKYVTNPPMCFFQRAVLSASPSHTSDCVLMVIDGGDSRWNRISQDHPNIIVPAPYADVVYFNGHFYAIDYRSRIVVCDLDGIKTQVVAEFSFEMKTGHFYILESLGSLFIVWRNGNQLREVEDDRDRIPLTLIFVEEDDLTYWTKDFRVFQVDLAAGKVTETRELGDTAFFVGANASLSVQASQFPGIKPNHIYFTDDAWETYLEFEEGGGFDMGVFNLADGSIQRHYEGVSLSRVCPPTWVTPTLY